VPTDLVPEQPDGADRSIDPDLLWALAGLPEKQRRTPAGTPHTSLERLDRRLESRLGRGRLAIDRVADRLAPNLGAGPQVDGT
jgi:hypothetical protein